jgi:hypothetical protein
MTAPTGLPSIRSGSLATCGLPLLSGLEIRFGTRAAVLPARPCFDALDSDLRLSDAFMLFRPIGNALHH